MKRYLLAVLLTGCHITSVPPSEPCTAQHSWENYHLAHDSLSPVVVNRSGYTPDLASWNALQSPITLRSEGSGFELQVIEGGDATSGWLGLASVRASQDHILEATVTMNRTLLDTYPPEVADHVLCQEIGHLLGLDHQHANDSCMDDCQGRGSHSAWLACLSSEAGQTPNAHDAEQLRAIYAHATGDAPPPPPRCTGTILIDIFHVEAP